MVMFTVLWLFDGAEGLNRAGMWLIGGVPFDIGPKPLLVSNVLSVVISGVVTLAMLALYQERRQELPAVTSDGG